MSNGALTDGGDTPGSAPPGSAIEAESLYSGRTPPDTGADASNPPQIGSIHALLTKFTDPNNIRSLRNQLRLSQRQFARLVGVSPGSIGGWESGGRVPNLLHQRLLGVLSGCFGGIGFYSDWRQSLDRDGSHSLEAFFLLTTERGGS